MIGKRPEIGLIGSQLGRKKKTRPLKFTRGLFEPAIAELRVALDVVETNAPINEKEGHKAQAKLERENARSYKAAISHLKKA